MYIYIYIYRHTEAHSIYGIWHTTKPQFPEQRTLSGLGTNRRRGKNLLRFCMCLLVDGDLGFRVCV